MFYAIIATVLSILIVRAVLSSFANVEWTSDFTYFLSLNLLTYWPKWLWRVAEIWIWQKRRPKKFANYSVESDYDNCGVVPNSSEIVLERTFQFTTEEHEDSVFIWGGDKNDQMILANVKLHQRKTFVTLIVKDIEGNSYTLPYYPDSNFVNIDHHSSWRGSGLMLECVEPMRIWRIKFNGLLRKMTGSDHKNNDLRSPNSNQFSEKHISESDSVGIKSDKEMVHVRLDFLWTAMRRPVDIWSEASAQVLAHALAKDNCLDTSNLEVLQQDGYDQWGSLHGMIKIGNQQPQNWYLRGVRQRRWGTKNLSPDHHLSTNFITYFSNGEVLSLIQFSLTSGDTLFTLGYMQTVAGDIFPISTFSPTNYEENKSGELNLIFEFCAKGRRTIACSRLFEKVVVYSGCPIKQEYIYRPCSIVSNTCGDGWSLLRTVKKNTGPNGASEIRFSCPIIPPNVPNSPIIINLENPLASNGYLSGGKGASLAALKYIENNWENLPCKFAVPCGFVISTEAWKKQLNEYPNLQESIGFLEKATSSDIDNLQEICVRTEKLVGATTICEEVIEFISNEFISTYKESLCIRRFAVRSSAYNEDSSNASSAGQNKTFLGCYWNEKSNEERNVIKAIAECWASQFSFESVEYKRQRGQPINDGMAVVIQEMVNAEAAGVMFTRDSVTGSPEFITICSNFGLGESVVSAMTEPDTISVSRSWDDKLVVHSRQTGEKKIKCVMKEFGGIEEVKLDLTKREQVSLTDEICLNLAKIGLIAENYFGSARDIEFAIEKGKIFLLQARPITFLEDWTDYELNHEHDFPVVTDEEMFTIANVGEVLPGAVCPLSSSVICKLVDLSIQGSHQERYWPYYHYNPYTQPILGTYKDNAFLNVYELMLREVPEDNALASSCHDLALFGKIVVTPEMCQKAISRYGMVTSLRKLQLFSYLIKEMMSQKRVMTSAKSIYENYKLELSEFKSSTEIYEYLCFKFADLVKISNIHCKVSSLSIAYQLFVFMVLVGNKDTELNLEDIQDMTSILTSMKGAESAGVPAFLKELARTIAGDDEVDKFTAMTPEEGKVWLQNNCSDAGDSFRSFLQAHGHRSIRELDLRSETWAMRPESLIPSIQAMVNNPATYENSEVKLDILDTLDKLKTPVEGYKRKFLNFLVKKCEKSVSNRECTKSLFVRTTDAFRQGYRALGQAMVLEGRLPHADLVFFLTHWEIGQLLETRNAQTVLKAVRKRKLMRNEAMQSTYPEICVGIPSSEKFVLEEGEDTCISRSSKCIRGTPVCEKRARGIIRVVLSLDKASMIQNGDILVTHCTDIGWSPYFPLLSGVVTEIGGLISHGAVVAREYGLPCVIGVKNATNIFKSGEKVTIDGGEGTIYREDLDQ